MEGEGDSGPKLTMNPADLRDYFREGLTEAATRQKVELDDPLREYLVTLLSSYSDLTDLLDEPIGVTVLKAMQAPPARRFQTLRQVGDYSLYVTGFFGDSISRTVNDEKYFIDLGAGAYRGAASSLTRGGSDNPFRTLLVHLGDRFVELVDLLNDLSERCFCREQDVLRLYDRFTATGSPRVAARLAGLGVAVGARTRFAH
jgi:hypothetical protein